VQGFHPVAIGTTASTPPYVAVLAVLATVLGGKPWLAVNVILLGCVPLAGATAFLATRRVTSYMPARVVGALAYALLPVGIGAAAGGAGGGGGGGAGPRGAARPAAPARGARGAGLPRPPPRGRAGRLGGGVAHRGRGGLRAAVLADPRGGHGGGRGSPVPPLPG